MAHIVEGVTKLDKIKFANREDHQAENIRKMLLAMVTVVRVVLIKLADRLHNMRTLQHLKPEKQQKIAKETLDIYAPLAHRLGMGKLRGELEDLAFRYTDPIAYKQVEDEVETLRGANEEFLASIVTEIQRVREVVALLDAGRTADIGPLLDASHTSLAKDFQVSCRELDLACEIARASGAFGARMVGGGFGGSAIALVPFSRLNDVTDGVRNAFSANGLRAPEIRRADPSEGATRLPLTPANPPSHPASPPSHRASPPSHRASSPPCRVRSANSAGETANSRVTGRTCSAGPR